MKLSGKKVLISGASGFIGSNLVRRLLGEGCRVSILTRRQSAKWRIQGILKNVKNYTADVTDRRMLKKAVSAVKPDIILQTSVYGGHRYQDESGKIFDTNIIGAKNLLDVCLEEGFGLYINTGSSSEYGVKHSPMKEGDILRPVTEYGISKAWASMYCKAAAEINRAPVTTLRIFSPYGYYDSPTRLIPYLVTSCLRGRNPRIISGKAVRDFVFINDVVDAYINTIRRSEHARGEIFNIGSGRQVSVMDVAEKILLLTGSRSRIVSSGADERANQPKRWQADISKAGRVLGWKPKTDISQGLEKTIEWFSENLKLYSR